MGACAGSWLSNYLCDLYTWPCRVCVHSIEIHLAREVGIRTTYGASLKGLKRARGVACCLWKHNNGLFKGLAKKLRLVYLLIEVVF